MRYANRISFAVDQLSIRVEQLERICAKLAPPLPESTPDPRDEAVRRAQQGAGVLARVPRPAWR